MCVYLRVSVCGYYSSKQKRPSDNGHKENNVQRRQGYKKGWIIYALWQYNDGKKGDTNIQFTYSSQVLNRREKKPVAHKMFKGCLLVK